jgi:hypothetical protein
MFGQIRNIIADALTQIAAVVKEPAPKPIDYLPPEPIGEIRPGKHRGHTAYFWLYREHGRQQRKYLSRDKKIAEQRREELSGFLVDPD